MNPLSKILDDAMRRLDLGEAALDARAVMLWPEIVGPQMAKASEAQKVQAGTLVVTARSSAWNQELTFQRQTILRRYRERLGKEYIKDLRVTVGAVRGVSRAPGIGSAFLSTFRFGVSGKASRRTIRAGTIWTGSTRDSVSRRARSSTGSADVT